MIAFTICSNNYYHQARVLAVSWLEHHPDSRFFIILVDRVGEGLPYDVDPRVRMIPLEQLGLEALPALVRQYNIIELNTAVKADAFFHLFRLTGESKILYLDPDIKVYSPLTEVDGLLDAHNIVLTPHYTTPIDDGRSSTDIVILRSGLFNLGFIGLSDLAAVTPFLEWWRERLYVYGYFRQTEGMFYDQAWCNFVPVFFDNSTILKNPGYNMANWNLHERTLSEHGGVYHVNEQWPLRFFHFSGFRYTQPEQISHYHTRYTFATRPDILGLHQAYRQSLADNHAERFRVVPCHYFEEHKRYVAAQAKAAWDALPWRTRLRKKVLSSAIKLSYALRRR
jgi:hypothetical protein